MGGLALSAAIGAGAFLGCAPACTNVQGATRRVRGRRRAPVERCAWGSTRRASTAPAGRSKVAGEGV